MFDYSLLKSLFEAVSTHPLSMLRAGNPDWPAPPGKDDSDQVTFYEFIGGTLEPLLYFAIFLIFIIVLKRVFKNSGKL